MPTQCLGRIFILKSRHFTGRRLYSSMMCCQVNRAEFIGWCPPTLSPGAGCPKDTRAGLGCGGSRFCPTGEGGPGLSLRVCLQLSWAVPVPSLQPCVTHTRRSREADPHDMCVTGVGNTISEIRLGSFYSFVSLSMQWEQIRKA